MAARAAGVLDPEIVDWFASRGVGDAIDRVTTPTMFLQGTVDTLFPLDEATANYRSLRDRGVPTKLMWFCGGHGVCLTNTDDAARVRTATLEWLARYLRGDDTVDTGRPSTSWTTTARSGQATTCRHPPGISRRRRTRVST
jgi:ABC-2 type transport system ATP-binding protein